MNEQLVVASGENPVVWTFKPDCPVYGCLIGSWPCVWLHKNEGKTTILVQY